MSEVLPQLAGDDLELLAQTHETALRMREECAKVIVGQEATINAVLTSVFSQGHTLIIGVPGLAKTLLVRTLAEVLGWSFKRIQFTPDMMPADIIGMELLQHDAQSGDRKMQFVQGPLFSQMILADEINRTPPKTQSALLEAMQEFTVTSMGHTHHLPRPFLVFATQNPIEQEGTYPLPEAQLDRFMFSLWMDYPDAAEEVEIALSTTENYEPDVNAICSVEDILVFQQLVRRVPVSRHVAEYAVMLARATRPGEVDDVMDYVTEYVAWGAGPRASQHMILAAKALAVLNGEPAVSAKYIRKVAPLVLRHRILPNFSATGEGIDARAIVKYVIEEAHEPVAS